MSSSEVAAPAAKRPCTISREQLIKRCKLEGISFRSNVRVATMLDAANAHGLLALAPEPQMTILDLPLELIEMILRTAIFESERHHRQADVLFRTAATCKALYHLITQDPNSLLWRAAWSLVARDEKQVTSGTSTDDFGAPQPFMRRVKLLSCYSCEFCFHYQFARNIHWQLGVRCCGPCFTAQTCTDYWARHHLKLPADLVATLPFEKVYDRYKADQRATRLLKRDLCPLMQQVHGPHVTSIAACEQHCAEIKRAKAEALEARRRKAAARKAQKLARQQKRAAKKALKEEAQRAKAASKAAAEAGGGATVI